MRREDPDPPQALRARAGRRLRNLLLGALLCYLGSLGLTAGLTDAAYLGVVRAVVGVVAGTVLIGTGARLVRGASRSRVR